MGKRSQVDTYVLLEAREKCDFLGSKVTVFLSFIDVSNGYLECTCALYSVLYIFLSL